MTTLRAMMRGEAFFIVLVYALAHGLMLFNDGLFWDDWCIIGVDRGQLAESLRQMGVPLLSELHLGMTALPGAAIAYRVVTFASFLVAALALLGVLRTVTAIDARSRLGICLVFAVLPVNAARVPACCLHYAVCYALFFIGAWLLARNLTGAPRWMRVLSWICLVLSWSTTSLLAFQPVIVAYAWLVGRGLDSKRRGPIASLAPCLDLIILPIAYLIVRITCFQPYGEYSGYNHITLKGLLNPLIIDVFRNTLTCDWDFLARRVACVVALFLCAVAVASFARRESGSRFPTIGSDSSWFAFGAVALLLGIYPYTVVGKIPSSIDWNSRFQLLYPLGCAFMICYGLRATLNILQVPDRWRDAIRLALIAPIAALCMVQHLDFHRDWHRQLALMSCFRQSDEIRGHATFRFMDRANAFNANSRVFRFYEYTGMMKRAFGDEDRFGDGSVQQSDPAVLPYPSLYSVSTYRPGPVEFEVAILPAAEIPAWTHTIAMMWWRLADSPRFDREIEGLIALFCNPVVPPTAAP